MSDRAPSECPLRSWMLRNIHEQKWPPGRKAYLVKLGLKSFVDGRQDICKDKESHLGSVVGY